MKTIMLVEDNNEVRNEIYDVFKMEGFDVIEAVNGLEGYLKATNNLPDIIISDIMMPVLNGYKMLQELKNNPITAQIPIIFLSALSSDQDIRKGMNLGAEDYLKKPINTEYLIQATKNKLKKISKFHEQYDNIKTNITNILYHELNTPLSGIIGFSDYLRTQAHELSSDNVKKIAENIYISGERLNKLIKRYLHFSELKLKSLNMAEIKKTRNCDFIEIVDIIRKILELNQYKKRKNDFNVSLVPVKLKIKDYYFNLLMEELIDNAVKFSSPGHKIFIESFVKESTYTIKVKNQGFGLPKEKIMEINDFNQMDTKIYAQNGSGIGLSIVKLIMEIYGEDFEINSVQNAFFEANVSFYRFISK